MSLLPVLGNMMHAFDAVFQVSRFLKLNHWSQPLRKSIDREMEIEKLRVISVERDR